MVDEKVHSQDIAATIISLAVKGYLTIKEEEKKGVFKSNDYKLTLTGKDEGGLLDFEKSTLDMLFTKSRKKSTNLNSLPANSYKYLDQIKKDLYKHLTKEKYFVNADFGSPVYYLGRFFALRHPLSER